MLSIQASIGATADTTGYLTERMIRQRRWDAEALAARARAVLEAEAQALRAAVLARAREEEDEAQRRRDADAAAAATAAAAAAAVEAEALAKRRRDEEKAEEMTDNFDTVIQPIDPSASSHSPASPVHGSVSPVQSHRDAERPAKRRRLSDDGIKDTESEPGLTARQSTTDPTRDPTMDSGGAEARVKLARLVAGHQRLLIPTQPASVEASLRERLLARHRVRDVAPSQEDTHGQPPHGDARGNDGRDSEVEAARQRALAAMVKHANARRSQLVANVRALEAERNATFR